MGVNDRFLDISKDRTLNWEPRMVTSPGGQHRLVEAGGAVRLADRTLDKILLPSRQRPHK